MYYGLEFSISPHHWKTTAVISLSRRQVFFPGGTGAIDLKGSLQIIIPAPVYKSQEKKRNWIYIYSITQNAMLWLIEQILKEQLEEGARGSLLSAKSIQWIFNRAWQSQLLQFNLKDMVVCNVMPVTEYIYLPCGGGATNTWLLVKKNWSPLDWKLVATFICILNDCMSI